MNSSQSSTNVHDQYDGNSMTQPDNTITDMDDFITNVPSQSTPSSDARSNHENPVMRSNTGEHI